MFYVREKSPVWIIFEKKYIWKILIIKDFNVKWENRKILKNKFLIEILRIDLWYWWLEMLIKIISIRYDFNRKYRKNE